MRQHAVKTRSGRAGDEQFAGGAERQVIRRHGRFERGEYENLAVGIDLENRAAAVAHKKIADGIERDSGGDAHAFDPKLRAAVRRDAMDGPVVAAGDVEISFAVQRQARGIHEFGDEGFHRVVGRDLVERDGDLLPAVAAVGDVDVSFDVHRGIRHGVKIVGDLHAEVKRERLAGRARSFHAHDAARRAFRHARDQIILRGDQQAGFGFAEAHVRPRVGPGNEARAVNRDVAAGDACTRLDAVNARYAVGFQI